MENKHETSKELTSIEKLFQCQVERKGQLNDAKSRGAVAALRPSRMTTKMSAAATAAKSNTSAAEGSHHGGKSTMAFGLGRGVRLVYNATTLRIFHRNLLKVGNSVSNIVNVI